MSSIKPLVINSRTAGHEYFLNVSSHEDISPEDYIKSRLMEDVSDPKVISTEWNRWIVLLKKCDVQEWKDKAGELSQLSKAKVIRIISEAIPSPDPQDTVEESIVEGQQPFITPLVEESSSLPAESVEHSSSSLSTMDSALSPSVISMMRDEFKANFEDFQGSSWIAPSNNSMDEALYNFTVQLEAENPLHSFILDQTADIEKTLDNVDKQHFRKTIQDHDNATRYFTVSDEFQQEILKFSLPPDDLERMMRRGWEVIDEGALSDLTDRHSLEKFRKLLYRTMFSLSLLYEDHNNKLPLTKLESWYTSEVWSIFLKIIVVGNDSLTFTPGEKCSVASGERRNSSRLDVSTRQAIGSKLDGLISGGEAFDELLAIEVARFDSGTKGTKFLSDGVKIAKVMKDMYDRIFNHCRWSESEKENLEVYGLLISQFRVDFLSLRRLKGRYYRLQREESITVPTEWTDESIRRILALISEFLLLRMRVESMAKNINLWSNPINEDILKILNADRRKRELPKPPRTLMFNSEAVIKRRRKSN
ncbi:hypothetical protein BGZ76_010657 [Entomortierella beljakovae]|nr:hypothetical protein BGZ76_010657 [Entomortierella beljakovae]